MNGCGLGGHEEKIEKFKVQFSVTYEVTVECKRSELKDEICDLNIPEDNQTIYVSDTIDIVVNDFLYILYFCLQKYANDSHQYLENYNLYY